MDDAQDENPKAASSPTPGISNSSSLSVRRVRRGARATERFRAEDQIVKFLLDTNIIAEIRKGSRGNANVCSWFAALDPEAILLSVETVGEI